MNWSEYIEQHRYDYDWENDDIFGIARQAYVAGLENALSVLLRSEDGDYDFHIFQLKKLIEESK